MALITRLSRLLTADFHAVLDRMEEPDLLLQQAIREMEADLLDREAAMKQLQQRRKKLGLRRDEASSSLAEIGEELSICLDSDNENLARVIVRRKLEAESFIRQATAQLAVWEQELLDAQTKFSEDQAQLESLRQKAEVFDAARGNGSDGQGFSVEECLINDNDVEVALLKEKHKRQLS